jgi:hypothetical protein
VLHDTKSKLVLFILQFCRTTCTFQDKENVNQFFSFLLLNLILEGFLPTPQKISVYKQMDCPAASDGEMFGCDAVTRQAAQESIASRDPWITFALILCICYPFFKEERSHYDPLH